MTKVQYVSNYGCWTETSPPPPQQSFIFSITFILLVLQFYKKLLNLYMQSTKDYLQAITGAWS